MELENLRLRNISIFFESAWQGEICVGGSQVPGKGETLVLACFLSLPSHQTSHAPFDGFGCERCKMGFWMKSKADWGTPGVPLYCVPVAGVSGNDF